MSGFGRIRRFFGGFAALAAVVLGTLGTSLFVIDSKMTEFLTAYSAMVKMAPVHAEHLPRVVSGDLFTSLAVIILAGCAIGIPILFYVFRHLYVLQGWCACAEELLSAKINGRDMEALGVDDMGEIVLATPAIIQRLGATRKWILGRSIGEVLSERADGYVLIRSDGEEQPVKVRHVEITRNPANLYVICG